MSTLRISISFGHEPIELDILLDKLTWSNLVTFIDSVHAIETPVTLYYKKDTEIETLQTQGQLTQLLIPNIRGLRFYTQKELVNKPVYILPGTNILATLAQFVEENKPVIASSYHLARSVGMLAFFIAQDTTEDKFEHEFEVFENLVTRKSKCREMKQAKETGDEQQDPCKALFGGRGGYHFGGRRGGHHFGGRGGHHFGGRGGFSSPSDPRKTFGGYGGPFRGHGKYFGSRGGHFDRFDGPFCDGRGGLFGGKDKQGRGGYTFSSDTEESDPFGYLEGFSKHARGFHGSGRFSPFSKHGKRGKFGRCGKFDSSSKAPFNEDEKLAWKMHLLNKLQRL